MKKPGAPKGNRNNKKPRQMDVTVSISCYPEQKKYWEQQAEAGGISLAAWIRHKLIG